MEGVFIVGGGLTGLVAGEQLGRMGVKAIVFEREAEAGGACRSIRDNGFTFDYTGHLLHLRFDLEPVRVSTPVPHGGRRKLHLLKHFRAFKQSQEVGGCIGIPGNLHRVPLDVKPVEPGIRGDRLGQFTKNHEFRGLVLFETMQDNTFLVDGGKAFL